jgi:hypothetical protein
LYPTTSVVITPPVTVELAKADPAAHGVHATPVPVNPALQVHTFTSAVDPSLQVAVMDAFRWHVLHGVHVNPSP